MGGLAREESGTARRRSPSTSGGTRPEAWRRWGEWAGTPVVVLTFDRDVIDSLWLTAYAPEFVALAWRRIPPLDDIEAALGGDVEVTVVPTPRNCVDGFAEAYYARPEMLLLPEVRRSRSGWSLVGPEVEQRVVRRLRADLDSGAWDRRYGHLRDLPAIDGSLRLVVARRAA